MTVSHVSARDSRVSGNTRASIDDDSRGDKHGSVAPRVHGDNSHDGYRRPPPPPPWHNSRMTAQRRGGTSAEKPIGLDFSLSSLSVPMQMRDGSVPRTCVVFVLKQTTFARAGRRTASLSGVDAGTGGSRCLAGLEMRAGRISVRSFRRVGAHVASRWHGNVGQAATAGCAEPTSLRDVGISARAAALTIRNA